jgi:hypothetical protein
MKQMTVDKDPPEVLYASFREVRAPALPVWDALSSELRRVCTWLYFQGVRDEAMEEQRRKLEGTP